jgi:hypothetical protein
MRIEPSGRHSVNSSAKETSTFCLWGRGVELLIGPLTLALNNQVRIFANLLCDVGVRYPAAFAVTAPVT